MPKSAAAFRESLYRITCTIDGGRIASVGREYGVVVPLVALVGEVKKYSPLSRRILPAVQTYFQHFKLLYPVIEILQISCSIFLYISKKDEKSIKKKSSIPDPCDPLDPPLSLVHMVLRSATALRILSQTPALVRTEALG